MFLNPSVLTFEIEREDLPEKYKNKTTLAQKANNFLFQSDIQKSKLSSSMAGAEVIKEAQDQQSDALFKKAALAEQRTTHDKARDDAEKSLTARSNKHPGESNDQKIGQLISRDEEEGLGRQTFDEEEIEFRDVDENVARIKQSSLAPPNEDALENDEDINQFFFEEDETNPHISNRDLLSNQRLISESNSSNLQARSKAN